MRRVAHPYTEWEDYRAGMYGQSNTAADHTGDAHELLADLDAFTEAMLGMLAEWPTAAEHRLTRPGAKSWSWLGAAACMWRHGAPQHTTRAAWWLLTVDQMNAANAAAEQVRQGWMSRRKATSDA